MHGTSQPVYHCITCALIEAFHGLITDGIHSGIDKFQCGSLLETEIVIHRLAKFLAAALDSLAADLSIHRDISAE